MIAVIGFLLYLSACSGTTNATGCQSVDEAQYLAASDGIMINYSDVSGKFASHLSRALADLPLLDDPRWRLEAVRLLASRSSVAGELRNLNPPASMRPIHHDYLMFAQETDALATMFVSWMDTGHMETLDEALRVSERVSDIIADIHDDIDRFCR